MKLKQSSFKTVVKLFCISFISMCRHAVKAVSFMFIFFDETRGVVSEWVVSYVTTYFKFRDASIKNSL